MGSGPWLVDLICLECQRRFADPGEISQSLCNDDSTLNIIRCIFIYLCKKRSRIFVIIYCSRSIIASIDYHYTGLNLSTVWQCYNVPFLASNQLSLSGLFLPAVIGRKISCDYHTTLCSPTVYPDA